MTGRPFSKVGEGHVVQGIARDLPHVDQALNGPGPVGSGRQQQRRDDGDDPEPAHGPARSSVNGPCSCHVRAGSQAPPNDNALRLRLEARGRRDASRTATVSEAVSSVEPAWAGGGPTRRTDASSDLPSRWGLWAGCSYRRMYMQNLSHTESGGGTRYPGLRSCFRSAG